MTGDAGAPLIWSNDCGSGRTVVCNIGIYDKVMRGFYAAAISLLGDATAYPVINSAVFYLDDFPAPCPRAMVLISSVTTAFPLRIFTLKV